MRPVVRVGAVWLALLAAGGPSDSRQSAPKGQPVEPPGTIVGLQPFRQSQTIAIRSKAGKDGTATLVNLHPGIDAWYLLTVAWADGSPGGAYHLENAAPRGQRLLLDGNYPAGLVVAQGGTRHLCELFGPGGALEAGRASPRVYYPLCEGRVYLRNPVTGHRTRLEAATEFLRDYVWGGEAIIGLGHRLFGDLYRETGKAAERAPSDTEAVPATALGGTPLPALVDPSHRGRAIVSSNLGIAFEGAGLAGMAPGAWYRARDNPGIWVSILQPNQVDAAILASYKTAVNPLDSAEASALSYLVAFDLDRFDLAYAVGTDHPRVDWSARAPEAVREAALPGPDGIGAWSPLVATGLISPRDAPRAAAAFTGGFKRAHGAFKYGDLALRNHGSHYGFIENGVVFSRLQPGLATLYVLEDGSVGMKTWAEADNRLLERIRYARQNGVPLVEFDPGTKTAAPGALVRLWGPGNWSGSQDGKLRTMRSGAALQRSGGKRFLLYAVFPDATPSAMVRVFQAYQAEYAMLLDMNALEHTYLAVYRGAGPAMAVDHLLKGMSALDKSAEGKTVPRFLGYADNRDFFYLVRRPASEGTR